MKIKDIFSQSLKNITRTKKATILNVLLMSVLFLITFLSLTFNTVIKNYHNDFYNKNYYGKQYMLHTKYENINIDELNTYLTQINGVVKTFKHSERSISSININNEIFGNGHIEIIGSDNDILPKIIKGDKFKENSNGIIELICPTKMLIENEQFFSTNYIDTFKYLNQKVELSKDEMDFTKIPYKIKETHKFEAEIIGLYDAQVNKFSGNGCFAKFAFVKNINDVGALDRQEALVVLINDNKNYENINNRIKEIFREKFNAEYSLTAMWSSNDIELDVVKSTIMLVVLVSLTVSIFSEILIISKNIKKRENEIGTLKALGYSNKEISKIYSLENIILLSISFLASLLIISFLLLVVYFLAKFKYYTLLNITFTIPIISILIVFSVVIILVTLISLITFKIMDSKSSSKLLGS